MPRGIPRTVRRRKGLVTLVDLMEFQAKELFAKHGVPTTLGVVAETAEAARAAAEEMGGVTVVKAQVKAGGRGKAGGVKIAKTADEAESYARDIIGMEIKGLRVNRVLVTPATPPVEEYYFSFLLDRSNRSHLCIAIGRGRRGDRGGRQDQPRRRQADPDRRPRRRRRGEGRARSSTRPSSPPRSRDQAIAMVQALWQVFVEEDATLVEVNPLARLEGDKLEALDGKVSLDDNAEFRHPDHAAFEIREETDPLEAKAKDKGLNYVKLDGQVGIIGNGAGLVMSHPRRRRVRR